MEGKDEKGRFVSGHKFGKGRPKGSGSIPDILRKIGHEEWETKDGKILGKKLEVILRKVYAEALDGRSWAVQFIADRTEGRAIERRQDVSDKPIQIFDRCNGNGTSSEQKS
jgi:hypothetical protein